MSELNLFLYLRISGVSFSIMVGATLTLMCDPLLGRPELDCVSSRLAREEAPKPYAWKERADGFFLMAGGWLTALRY